MFRPLSVFNRNRHLPALREDGDTEPFFHFHREMNRLFDDFFSDFGAPALSTFGERSGHRPVHIDYRDRGSAIEIEAELPGVEEKDIDVELQDNVLTIRAEKRSETDEDGRSGRRSARAYSSFMRSLSLPFEVDGDKVEADFRNGVLRLTLPKPAEVVAKSRKIPIGRK